MFRELKLGAFQGLIHKLPFRVSCDVRPGALHTGVTFESFVAARELGAKEEAETWLRAGHAKRLAGDASDGVPSDAWEAYEKAAKIAKDAGLDDLEERAKTGAEGKVETAEMLAGTAR